MFETEKKAGPELYYIQNKGVCGNCLNWWRPNGHGYTMNLDRAWAVTAEEARRICKDRPEQDIPWAASEIHAIAQRHVSIEDMRGLKAADFAQESSHA